MQCPEQTPTLSGLTLTDRERHAIMPSTLSTCQWGSLTVRDRKTTKCYLAFLSEGGGGGLVILRSVFTVQSVWQWERTREGGLQYSLTWMFCCFHCDTIRESATKEREICFFLWYESKISQAALPLIATCFYLFCVHTKGSTTWERQNSHIQNWIEHYEFLCKMIPGILLV